MRKQTRKWKTKDGRKIRICDMSDSHLLNTIKMLERNTRPWIWAMINDAESMSCTLQGEMALDAIDSEIMALYNMLDSPDPSYIWRIYENLVNDALRRDLQWEDQTRKS